MLKTTGSREEETPKKPQGEGDTAGNLVLSISHHGPHKARLALSLCEALASFEGSPLQAKFLTTLRRHPPLPQAPQTPLSEQQSAPLQASQSVAPPQDHNPVRLFSVSVPSWEEVVHECFRTRRKTVSTKVKSVNSSALGIHLPSGAHSPGTNPALPLQSRVIPKSSDSFETQVPALEAVTVRDSGSFWQGPAPY